MAINCTVLPSGDLKITADNGTRHDLAEWKAEGRDFWCILGYLFEPFFTNGSLSPFDAGQANPFVGLTSAPCIAESMTTEDDGRNVIEGRFWYYANYMLDDPLDDLRTKGRSIWQLA